MYATQRMTLRSLCAIALILGQGRGGAAAPGRRVLPQPPNASPFTLIGFIQKATLDISGDVLAGGHGDREWHDRRHPTEHHRPDAEHLSDMARAVHLGASPMGTDTDGSGPGGSGPRGQAAADHLRDFPLRKSHPGSGRREGQVRGWPRHDQPGGAQISGRALSTTSTTRRASCGSAASRMRSRPPTLGSR